MKDHMRIIKRGLIGASLLAALTACGSGGGFNGSSSSGTSTSGATTGSSLVELGSGSGTSFKNQVLAIQVSGTLSAGGSTQVTANIVDANNANALYTQQVTVNFTSNCVSAGTASITQSVSTSNGTAIATYTAQGCKGKDPITASATVGTSTLTATGSVTVAAATLGTLVFVSASPSVISVKGAGGVANSTVTFQVNDANGNPASGVTVDFGLSTTQGGISFSPTSQITGSNGQASTVITAGTVHTSVSVTGTIPSSSISQTAINAVSISTGVPVQSRFSLSIVDHNVQAFDHDGITDEVDVYVADIFGSPVAPGTTVAFVSNSGIISGTCPAGTPTTTACGSCETDANGHCSATWTSEGNRPLTDGLNVIGHAHILAYVSGEEAFNDKNDDGTFDNGDTFTQCGTCAGTAFKGDSFFNGTTLAGSDAPAFDDIGDPYMDSSETGKYLSPEPFEDIDSTVTTRRSPDGKWYGPGCGGFGTTTTTVAAAGGNVTCANKLTMIGKDDCIVMSTDVAPFAPPSKTIVVHTGDSVTATIADVNGNVIASGSTVSISSVQVTGVTLSITPASGTAGTSYTQPDQGCTTPGVSPAVQTFTITVTPNVGAVSFGGTFTFFYTSADGKTNTSSETITIN